MTQVELADQVKESLMAIAGKDLEGEKRREMDARVADFVREKVRPMQRDQILSRFDTPRRSLEAFWAYLDRFTEAAIDECCRCMEKEPGCALSGQ